jgi:tripartite-type tricarboxylate transporter receptor subunit TctC
VLVENRPGAAAAIARELVAKAPGDGYTLITDATSFAGYAVFTRTPTLDVQKAFVPISLLTESPGVLVARSDAPFTSFQEMIAYAKSNPGRMNYGGIGAGVILLTFEAMKAQYGVDIMAVDYKSSAEDYRAVLAGEVHLTSSTVSRVAQDVANGKVRALAISSATRHALLPSAPTSREVGFNGFYTSWQGLWAPAATPGDIVRTLYSAVADAAASKDVRESLERLEAIVIASTPEALAQRQDKDIREWRELVRKAGIPLQ